MQTGRVGFSCCRGFEWVLLRLKRVGLQSFMGQVLELMSRWRPGVRRSTQKDDEAPTRVDDILESRRASRRRLRGRGWDFILDHVESISGSVFEADDKVGVRLQTRVKSRSRCSPRRDWFEVVLMVGRSFQHCTKAIILRSTSTNKATPSRGGRIKPIISDVTTMYVFGCLSTHDQAWPGRSDHDI